MNEGSSPTSNPPNLVILAVMAVTIFGLSEFVGFRYAILSGIVLIATGVYSVE